MQALSGPDTNTVTNSSTDTSTGPSVTLSVGHKDFAVFNFHAPPHPSDDDNTDGIPLVPTQPSDFDLSERMKRLRRRALLQRCTVIGAIPMMHAWAHKCFRVLSAIVTSGVGAGHRVQRVVVFTSIE